MKMPNLIKPIFTLFQDKKNLIQERKCPECESKILLDSFKDEISITEYSISGLCQTCQDEIFGDDICG